MTERSIAAYDVSQRVKYDADMELIPESIKDGPSRSEVLPLPGQHSYDDLGIGTGYFTEQFLKHFPNSGYSASTALKPWLNWQRSA
jgi:hypothetical protein